MNKELIEALNALEKEKEISKETLFEAIENSLLTACKNHFGKADNVKVEIDRETGDFKVFVEKQVVETEEEVTDPMMFITLDDAVKIAKKAKALNLDAIHDTVHEMAKDEARHGAGFQGLFNRFFKK